MSQKKCLLLATLLAFSLLLPTMVQAGDESAPEIMDSTGDAEDEFQDISRCWVQNEESSQFELVFQMAGSPKVWEQGFLQTDSPIFNYEFYFSSKGVDYGVAALGSRATSVPVVGYDLVLYDAELRNITYVPGGDTISEEGFSSDIDVEWDMDIHAFVFIVSKNRVGAPQAEDKLTNLWAAVWNADEYPEGEQRSHSDAVDTAQSYTNPGLDYTFTGGLQFEYTLTLSSTHTNITVESNESLALNITVVYHTTNDEEGNASATLASILTGPGTAALSTTHIDFNGSGTRSVILNYTAPGVANDTTVGITITGEIEVTEGGNVSTFPAEPLNITLTIIPKSEPIAEEKASLLDFLLSPMGLGIIGAVVVLAIVGIALALRKKGPVEGAHLPPTAGSQRYPGQASQPVYYRPPEQPPR